MATPTWTQVPSPNRWDVRDRTVDTVVLHYTAGRGNAMSTAALFSLPKRKASAHFVVGRAGEIVQCVDLDDAAWHAGDGRFPSAMQLMMDRVRLGVDVVPYADVPKKPRDLNMRSIGIEVCNCGWAEGAPGPYIEAKHRNPAARSTKWEDFPHGQVDAVASLLRWLAQTMPTLRYVTGHEDVTNRYTLGKPGAKLDPGPAFEWGYALNGVKLTRVMFNFEKNRQGWMVRA